MAVKAEKRYLLTITKKILSMETLRFNSEKIQFNDEIESPKNFILIISIIVLLSVTYLISTTMCAIGITFCSSSVICIIILLRTYLLRDFSKEIPLSDISRLKIIYRRNGNIILKTYRKKGKYRIFTSINNREEAHNFILFAKNNKLDLKIIDYTK